MRYIEKIGIGMLLLVTISAHAGWYANTAHSRANCAGFNESITWNWTEYHWWAVKSLHFKRHGFGRGNHECNAYMAYTWRAAAFDFNTDPMGEVGNNYWVQGYHHYMDYNGRVVYDAYTQADGCNLYDGWWEKNKARGE